MPTRSCARRRQRRALLKLVPVLACVAAAIAIPATVASATAPALRIDKALVNFGNQPFDSLTVKSFTVTNKTSQPLLVRVDEIQVPDDFSPGIEGSTCVLLENTPVPAGESCIVNVSFFPLEFFAGRESASLQVTALDEGGTVLYQREVVIKGRGVAPK